MMGDEAQVLIVCTGNICRSPFIERLLQLRLDEVTRGGNRAIVVSSAGTGALTGRAMDERAAAALADHGGDPAGFKARDLTPALIAEADLVLTATREHRRRVAAMDPRALRKVFTFCDFADLVTGVELPDSIVTQADSRSWVRQVTEAAAAGRGLNPPLELARAEIVDPFRRADEVFEAMAQQVIRSMPAAVRALAG